ncbi:Sec-independent protein translocase protein TatB [Luteimonas sp. RD2P54]|uniref:Sec-independent protein translocase protein TatB n=1 Tax=Luteimonas endophytica TaxID=3042023 RepID=A0ABT6J776_9GAMM|nr:Sec-independent protein translocase protein TatB [Luteimonas endophytica]MDH5822053.1 Sec-independent protein translocase protein TatB [Luteimonas endophytica]
MFDIGFSELFLIAVVALVVLGPERLPRAARFAGLWVRRARAQWHSVRSELERELAAEELKRSLHDAEDAMREVDGSVRDARERMRSEVDAVRDSVRETAREVEAGMGRRGRSGEDQEAGAQDAAAPALPATDQPQPPPAPAPAPPEDDDAARR